MNREKEVWPFLIISPLTEESGHLLSDDAFWFSGLSAIDSRTEIYSSATSVSAIAGVQPGSRNRCKAFKDWHGLKRINYRVFLLWRLMRMPHFRKRRILVQGFEELTLLVLLYRIRCSPNHVTLVLTNNVSPERLARSGVLLGVLLRTLFSLSDVVYYHSDFQYALIRKMYGTKIMPTKFTKIKYHRIGAGTGGTEGRQPASNVITFFGPASEVKPIAAIYPLIEADSRKVFRYVFINLTNEDARGVKKKFPGSDNIFFRHGYLTDEAYQMAICDSRFVFLPHNRFFEGKVSGILSDCIANKVPIISDAIEPVIEFSHTYGAMGYLCDYASQHWAQQIVNGLSDDDYEKFREAMRVCVASHSPTVIMNELLAADNCGVGRIQQSA